MRHEIVKSAFAKVLHSMYLPKHWNSSLVDGHYTSRTEMINSVKTRAKFSPASTTRASLLLSGERKRKVLSRSVESNLMGVRTWSIEF